MSVYKPFTTSDVVVTPFKVNKSFSFEGASALTASNVGIDRFIGKNIQSTFFVSGSNPTGQISSQNQELVYESIKQLYYSNYLRGEDGSTVNTASFNTDGTITATGGATVSVTGQLGTGAVGSVNVVLGITVSVTGQSATGAVGSVTIVEGTGVDITLTGQSSTGAVGSPTIVEGTGVDVTLDGQSATGEVGVLLGWVEIDDSQNITYFNINDSQSITWSEIDDSQQLNFIEITPSSSVTYSEITNSETTVYTEIDDAQDRAA